VVLLAEVIFFFLVCVSVEGFVVVEVDDDEAA